MALDKHPTGAKTFKIYLMIHADQSLRPRTSSMTSIQFREWNVISKFSYWGVNYRLPGSSTHDWTVVAYLVSVPHSLWTDFGRYATLCWGCLSFAFQMPLEVVDSVVKCSHSSWSYLGLPKSSAEVQKCILASQGCSCVFSSNHISCHWIHTIVYFDLWKQCSTFGKSGSNSWIDSALLTIICDRGKTLLSIEHCFAVFASVAVR